jgi:hypothetical protein
MEQLLLSKFDYYIEESDPDIVILRRQDGAFVAAFSGRGATREGIGSSRRRRPKEERLTWCALIHPSAWNRNSRKFGCRIVHISSTRATRMASETHHAA